MAWQVYDAKARFSELLDTALKDGPQVITRRGVETAVLVPIDEWKRLKDRFKPPFPDPLRRRLKLRPFSFDDGE